MAEIAWWWSIPIGATLLAVLWAAWASRPKPPADTHDSLQSHQRFRAAMEHDTFGGRRSRGDDPGDVRRPAGDQPDRPE
jgi:hypothetical protein